MPRFFIDTYNGRTLLIDRFGIDSESIEDAAEEVAALLPDFAREVVPDGQSHDFAALVRNDSGNIVYRAALLFRGRFNASHIDEKVVTLISESMNEVNRSENLRREAIEIMSRVTKATDELWGTCMEARSTLEASQRERERRLGI